MPKIKTGNVEIMSKSNAGGAETWNPISGPLETYKIRWAKVDAWLAGLSPLIKARLGFEFSDDMLTWSNKTLFDVYTSTAYVTAEGWTFGDSYQDISSTNTNVKLYVRFGMNGVNVSGTALESALAALLIDCKPVTGGVLLLGPIRLGADSSTWRCFPLSEAIPADSANEVRVAMEIIATVGNCNVQAYWEASNKPDDPTSWVQTGAPTLNTAQSAVGFYYPTGVSAFNTVNTTYKYVRFGLRIQTDGTASLKTARAALRVEYRL
jgi:hypothetical protein